MKAKTTDDFILCVNCGSSSLKVSLFFAADTGVQVLVRGGVDGLGSRNARGWLRGLGTDEERPYGTEVNHAEALDRMMAWLGDVGAPSATLVAHRVVHGGPWFSQSVLVNPSVVAKLRKASAFAPLHMPEALAGIEAMMARDAGLPQVVCFDTAFHASMPDVARHLPLPRAYQAEGIRRYGFHGLSYEYVMSTLGASCPRKVVLAHLGGGASLVAVRDGRAIDTTMGFTPSGGIMMGTRSGDVDPGLVAYLLREKAMSVDSLEHLFDDQSGLVGVGGTADVKSLVERIDTDPEARLALEMFAYGVRKTIGSFAAVLGGLDLLVFTGGIGEHVSQVRAMSCEGLAHLGIHLDADRNTRSDLRISSDSAPCEVRVVATHEDVVMARHALRVARVTSDSQWPDKRASSSTPPRPAER